MTKNIELFLIGCLLIFCGIYLLISPQTALIASALSIGIILILLGIGYLLTFKKHNFYPSLTLGLLDILVGSLFLINIPITATTMPIIFSFWVLFNALSQIIMSFELQKESDHFSKPLFIIGLIGIFISVLIFIYPIIGTLTITFLLGSYLIGYGLLELHRYFKAL